MSQIPESLLFEFLGRKSFDLFISNRQLAGLSESFDKQHADLVEASQLVEHLQTRIAELEREDPDD